MKEILRKFLLLFKKHSFKNLSIFFKLSFTFFLIILFVILLSFADSQYYKADKSKVTLSIVSQMNLQAISEIDSYIENITTLTKTPLYYDNNNTRVLENLKLSNKNHTFFSIQKDLDYIIEQIFSLKKELHSVVVYNLIGNNDSNSKNGSILRFYDPRRMWWFKKSVSDFGKVVIIPTFPLSDISNINNYPSKVKYVFSAARALVRYDDSSVVGIILINTSINTIGNITKKLSVYPGQRILLVNNKGYTIYDTVEKNISKIINANDFNTLLDSNYISKQANVNGVDSLITRQNSTNTDWHLINIIPTTALNSSINRMNQRTYTVTFIFVIFACIFIIIMAKQIVNPIKHLSNVMKIVEKGDFDIKASIDGDDEIGHLAKTFNIMTGKIKELINEVYVDKIKQKDLELQRLQTQINPHFLYNTLESIHMMAEINNDHETSKMAVTLGNLFRYGLSNKYKKVTVRDELKNIEAYIMLQKIRYENISDVIVNVDKSLYDKEIIRLIFQPIIENAIYHGLSSMEDGGILKILGYAHGSTMVFELCDNGEGMNEEKLELLNGYINELNDSFKSIGLRNVNMRIKLQYGSSYGLFIFSKKGDGTTVKVIIPYL